MTKRLLALSLTCVLSLSLVSCTDVNKFSTEDTSNKETKQTETATSNKETESVVNTPAKSHNTKIKTAFYNYLDGQTYGGYLSDKTCSELVAAIKSVKTTRNLINKYNIKENSKSKKITPIMEITTEDETIKYLGKNTWSFQTGDEISIYKTNGAKKTELPCAFMAAQLCIPYAFSKSNSDKETNNDYLQLRGLDTQDIADNTQIDYSHLSEQLYMTYPDSPVVSEEVYLFNGNNKYIHYTGVKILDSRSKKAYRFQKDDNVSSFYYYFRYGDDTYCRESSTDTYHETKKFKDDFFIKDENLYFEQLVKNFEFQFSFPIKVYDKTYAIEMYKNNDSYLGILVNDINHPGKSWLVNNDGISIATDLIYNEISSTGSIEEGFQEELDSIKKVLSKDKKNNKKQQ